MKLILCNLITTLALFLPLRLWGQTNIMSIDWKKLSDLESSLQLEFRMATTAVHFSLKDATVEDLNYYVKGCKKSKVTNGTIPFENTVIGFKQNKNLIWTFYFVTIYSRDGKLTDSVYTGYSKTEFGEQSEEYLIKIKKTRIYPENNIFTERVTIGNGVTFIIEDRLFIRKILFSDEATLSVNKYYFEYCDK